MPHSAASSRLLLLVACLALLCCSVSATSLALRRPLGMRSLEWRAVEDASGVEGGLVLHGYTTGAAGTAQSQLVPFAAGASVKSLLRSALLADLLLDRGLGAASRCKCELLVGDAPVDAAEELREVLLTSEASGAAAELHCLSKNGRAASWSLTPFVKEQLDVSGVRTELKRERELRGESVPLYPITSAELLAENWEGVAGWVTAFIENHWGPVHEYPAYGVDAPGTGRWHLNTGAMLQRGDSFDPWKDGERVRLAIAADWGAGTVESDSVQAVMMNGNGTAYNPHWTLHIGDIYYVGSTKEVQQNCLGIVDPAVSQRAVTWPHGSLGSFAVQGNHEMYARGYGFFDTFLPTLGARLANGSLSGQGSGYVALENAFWRVILLDTGYGTYSLEPKFDSTNNTQPQAIVDWLRDEVQIGNASDTRGLIFFSHHQVLSAFGAGSLATPFQIADLLPPNRTVLWLWGHEHRLAFYDPQTITNPVSGRSFAVQGRCVGNSGFPSNTAPLPPHAAAQGLKAYDDRAYRVATGFFNITLSFNGFAHLDLEGPAAVLTYSTLMLDTNATTPDALSNTLQTDLVMEKWEADPRTGNVQLLCFDVLDPALTVVQPEVRDE